MWLIDWLTIWMAEPTNAFRVVALTVCVAHLIAAAQLLASRDLLKGHSVLSWGCVRLRYRWFKSRPVERLAALIYEYPGVLILISAKLLAAASLWVMIATGRDAFGLLLILVMINAVVTVRVPYGSNAADEMATIATVALLVGAATRHRTGLGVALWFIGAQATLAYSTAGLFKIRNRGWYDGTYMRDLFSTGSYGTPWAARLLRRSTKLAKAIGTSVVLGESLFILLLFIPPSLCIIGLGIALIFHVAIAVVMGLNSFVWSFAATYPAVLFCNLSLHGR